MPTAVWKVGGSLFDLPDLATRLRGLLMQQRETQVLLIPGGGATADVVRRWQHKHGLDDEAAHWLAIRAMDFNAHLLAAIVARGEFIHSRDDANDCWRREGTPVLSVTAFVQTEERGSPTNSLPHDWTVTSDSLAAWIAARWPAEELVLLKSRPLEAEVDAANAAQRNWVDAYFPQIAPRVPRIHWCNLREPVPRIQPWLQHGAIATAE